MARATPKEIVGGQDAHIRVARLFSNPFTSALLRAETFYQTLQTQEERKAFSELFPDRFAKLFGFTRNSHEHFPSSADHQTRVFRRWKVLEFLQAHPAAHEFDAPDLRSIPYAERHIVMALARAKWWTQCRLPMLSVELEWLKQNAPELLATAQKCPLDDGGWDQAHDPWKQTEVIR